MLVDLGIIPAAFSLTVFKNRGVVPSTFRRGQYPSAWSSIRVKTYSPCWRLYIWQDWLFRHHVRKMPSTKSGKRPPRPPVLHQAGPGFFVQLLYTASFDIPRRKESVRCRSLRPRGSVASRPGPHRRRETRTCLSLQSSIWHRTTSAFRMVLFVAATLRSLPAQRAARPLFCSFALLRQKTILDAEVLKAAGPNFKRRKIEARFLLVFFVWSRSSCSAVARLIAQLPGNGQLRIFEPNGQLRVCVWPQWATSWIWPQEAGLAQTSAGRPW